MKTVTTHKFLAPISASRIIKNDFLPYIVANTGTKNILLVDASLDKSTITLKHTLVQHGHRVTHVQYRHEAVVYLLQEKFSLILVNVFDNKPFEIEARCSDRKKLDHYANVFNISILYLEELEYKKRDFRSYYKDVS